MNANAAPAGRLVVPAVPALAPRLLLATGAMVLAILAPIPAVAVLALAVAITLWHLAGGAGMRAAGWLGVMTLAATLIVTPLWLTFLAGIAARDAVAVAAAFAVRLATLAFIGVALATALPPRAWLAGLRRFPRTAVALTVTFRQVPEVAADALRVRRLQRGRGLLVGVHRWRPLVILVPLVARSLERADRLGRALVLAGWGTGHARPLVRARYGARDAAYLLLGGLLAAAPLAL